MGAFFPNNPNIVFHIILMTPLLENYPTLQTGDWRRLTQLFTQYTQPNTPYICIVSVTWLNIHQHSSGTVHATCIIKPNQNDIHNIHEQEYF